MTLLCLHFLRPLFADAIAGIAVFPGHSSSTQVGPKPAATSLPLVPEAVEAPTTKEAPLKVGKYLSG